MNDAAPTTVVTRDLVARVEQAILAERRAFALGSPGERPDGAVLEIGSGAAIFTGPELFSNRVFGVGLDGSLAEGDLDRFEAFYRRRGVRTQVEVATLVNRSFLQQLAHRPVELDDEIAIDSGLRHLLKTRMWREREMNVGGRIE